ncbi:MAG: 30S ribosome-binding factor RbfA [Sorangiineae bacterium]|nr:30S ribosome-binding factor RbfA [Polyangiaceae bacterium]MEB2323112.1 30S ribosome-binding factor RbfA [Sorangiineae bacterium]
MSEGGGRRADRVAGALRAALGDIMSRELDDPRLAAVVVTGIAVADDLSTARVSVRLLVGEDDARARAAALRSLTRAAGRMRHLLGPMLDLKKLPALVFAYDTGPDAARRVDELLREIDGEKPR